MGEHDQLTGWPDTTTRPLCRAWATAAARGLAGHGPIIRRAWRARAGPDRAARLGTSTHL
jgi:hypothetical protein